MVGGIDGITRFPGLLDLKPGYHLGVTPRQLCGYFSPTLHPSLRSILLPDTFSSSPAKTLWVGSLIQAAAIAAARTPNPTHHLYQDIPFSFSTRGPAQLKRPHSSVCLVSELPSQHPAGIQHTGSSLSHVRIYSHYIFLNFLQNAA